MAFFWINLTECDFEPIKFHLGKDEAYLKDMYTMESYTGKNLATYLRYKSYPILKEMGREKIYSVVEYFNTSATKYKQKLNPEKLKLILYIQICKKLRWSVTIKSY